MTTKTKTITTTTTTRNIEVNNEARMKTEPTTIPMKASELKTVTTTVTTTTTRACNEEKRTTFANGIQPDFFL